MFAIVVHSSQILKQLYVHYPQRSHRSHVQLSDAIPSFYHQVYHDYDEPQQTHFLSNHGCSSQLFLA